MADDKKRQALSEARQEYLIKREQLLQKKVDKLGLILFDKINEQFLKQLSTDPEGKIENNGQNIRAVSAIDAIYNNFNKNYNIPVIRSFTSDLSNIGPLNEAYFDEVMQAPTAVSRYRAETVVNEQLGLTRKGTLVKDGFTDKFIRSNEVVQAIKEKTLQAITQGKGFQQFRNDLKQTIQGVPKQNNGKLHQYYRNNAYDTYTKVDRLYSDNMAKDLKLTYFYWSGGVIPTTRALCRHMDGKIVNAIDFKKMKFKNLKLQYRPGVPDGKHSTWKPLNDLGGYGCRHTKDYISNAMAVNRMKDIIDVNTITIVPIKTQPKPISTDYVKRKAKQAGPELQDLQDKLSKKHGATATPVNYKSAESIERKVATEYKGDYEKLKDAVRTTIITDPDKIESVIKDIEKDSMHVRTKSQLAETDPLGYSGNIVSVKSKNGTLMEVQVNSPKIIYTKEVDAKLILGEKLFNQIKEETGLEHGLGHTYYEQFRVLNPAVKNEAQRMKEIAEKSKAYYSKFR